MNFADLVTTGRGLRPEAVNSQLRALLDDPKFPAVLAWLDRNERSWSSAVTNQKLAADHGKLAHAAGSLYALQILQSQLQNLSDKRGKPDAQE
jgi:hypothetical protein